MKNMTAPLVVLILILGSFMLTGAYSPPEKEWRHRCIMIEGSPKYANRAVEEEINNKTALGWQFIDSDPVYNTIDDRIHCMIMFRQPIE